MAKIFMEGFEKGTLDMGYWKKPSKIDRVKMEVFSLLLKYSKGLSESGIPAGDIYVHSGEVMAHFSIEDSTKPYEWKVEIKEA
jgi:hypothetical protein